MKQNETATVFYEVEEGPANEVEGPKARTWTLTTMSSTTTRMTILRWVQIPRWWLAAAPWKQLAATAVAVEPRAVVVTRATSVEAVNRVAAICSPPSKGTLSQMGLILLQGIRPTARVSSTPHSTIPLAIRRTTMSTVRTWTTTVILIRIHRILTSQSATTRAVRFQGLVDSMKTADQS